MRCIRLYLELEEGTAKSTLNIRKRLHIGKMIEFLKTHLECLVGSTETKGSVSIIKTGSSTQVRKTMKYTKTFTKMKSPTTPRILKEKFLRLIYYNTVAKVITIHQKRDSRSAGRAPKPEERKYNIKCSGRITGHYIALQSVVIIYFWFDWNIYGLSKYFCLNVSVYWVIWIHRVKLFSKKLNSIKNVPQHYIGTITTSFILSSYKVCLVTQTLVSDCQCETLTSVVLIFKQNVFCYWF